MYICLPAHPLYEDEEVSRHPQIKPIAVEDNVITFFCPNCEQEFKVKQVVTDAFE